MSPAVAPGPAAMPVSFEGRLEQGAFWEAWVGSVLARCGLYTLHHPSVPDKAAAWKESWDLDVFSETPGTFGFESCPTRKPVPEGMKRGGLPESTTRDGSLSALGPVPVEVKSSRLSFASPKDYPMPTALVCSQDSWMAKWAGKETIQREFLLVSRDTGHLVWIPTGTKVQMNHPVHDRNRSYSYKCVVVGKEQLRPFQEFVAHVKNS